MANDVRINVRNETDEFQNIVIFQQKDALNQMFDKLFPIAWKVFPLNGKKAGQIIQGSTIYPVEQTIGVTREALLIDSLPYGTLNITAEANNKDQFKYFLDANNAQNLELLPGKNDDETITCTNDTSERVSIAFCKNNSILVTQTNVPNGDKAAFKLTPKLYFMYMNNIKEGQIFKSMQTGEKVEETELTGYSTIVARLMYDPNVGGGKKMWKIERS